METVANDAEEWGKKLMLMRLHSIDIYLIYFKCSQVRILQHIAYIYGDGAYDDVDVDSVNIEQFWRISEMGISSFVHWRSDEIQYKQDFERQSKIVLFA